MDDFGEEVKEDGMTTEERREYIRKITRNKCMIPTLMFGKKCTGCQYIEDCSIKEQLLERHHGKRR